MADIQTVTEAKKLFTADLSALQKIAADAPAAVRDDASRIIDKYSLTPAGLPLQPAVLRPEDRRRTSVPPSSGTNGSRPSSTGSRKRSTARTWSSRSGPRAGTSGFREDRPLPDFLARLAKVSFSLPQGNFAGRSRT